MEKKIHALWIFGFVCLLLAPRLLWYAGAGGSGGHMIEAEKRALAEKPQLNIETYETFPQEFESYYNDNLAFRSKIIAANSLFSIALFHEAVGRDVIVGKENWLFYGKGSNIEDYKGINLYTNEQLEQIKDNLLTVQAELSGRGTEFLLMVAPNKETIYGDEYLPDDIKKCSEMTRAEQVISYIEENTDIPVVWPKDALLAEKGNYTLYWKYDTHWNAAGAYVGAKELMEALGVSMPALHELDVRLEREGNYDLAEMMNLRARYMSLEGGDIDYELSGYEQNGLEILEKSDQGNRRFCSDAPDERSLLVIRDSFGDRMGSYLGTGFKHVLMPHWEHSFTPEMVEEEQPDILVYEVVERELDRLLTIL